MMNARTVEDYLQLPYTIEVIRESDPEQPGWVGRVVELPGCISEADSFAELEGMIADAMRGWIEVALEDGLAIPEPQPIQDFSGKFVVRVPRSLHRQLVERAGREGVSLNAYINFVLAGSVKPGWIATEQGKREEDLDIEQWPGLSSGARKVLAANGYQHEAGQSDERLVADWINDHIEQAQVAIQDGNFEQGKAYYKHLHHYLANYGKRSPILHTFTRLVQNQLDLIEENELQLKGYVKRSIVENRIQSLENKETSKRLKAKEPTIDDEIERLIRN